MTDNIKNSGITGGWRGSVAVSISTLSRKYLQSSLRSVFFFGFQKKYTHASAGKRNSNLCDSVFLCWPYDRLEPCSVTVSWANHTHEW